MKAKIVIAILLGLSVLSFVSDKKTAHNYIGEQAAFSLASLNQDTSFIIGAMDDGFDFNFQYFDELDFNLWHKYIGSEEINNRHYPMGWTINGAPDDKLFSDTDVYVPQVRGILNNLSSHNLRSLMQRPKIEYLCYGQRSDYQCEPVTSGDLWFYSFNVHETGIQITDSGQQVIHCRTIPSNSTADDPGFVVKRLKANTEQCNSANYYNADGECNWFIKPRIRIDPSFVNNPTNWNTKVCKIIVVGQSGTDTLKTVDIKAINFRKDSDYNGEYLEEFYNLPDSLTILGAWGSDWQYRARGSSTADSANKADIQVYWYGNCDMWIDYVRVDNDVANELFKGQHNDWLQWEAELIACYNESPFRFYIELFEFNNIPCMSYVSRKLDSLAFAKCGKHITVTALPAANFYSSHVPWNERLSVQNTGHFIQNYVEKIGLRDIYIPCYPFFTEYKNPEPDPYYSSYGSDSCSIPNTLPRNHGAGIFAQAISPSLYDTWLQDHLDRSPYWYEEGYTGGQPTNWHSSMHKGAFRWHMKLGDEVSKAKDIPFLYNPQAHLWYLNGETLREPTNEELDMLANVSISYGVRGLIYFFYGKSSGQIGLNEFYSRGLTDTTQLPRTLNVYNQNKWEQIKLISERMKTWEPYIMSFDNTNRSTYILRLERSSLIDETFFNDVLSYEPIPSDYMIASQIPEAVSERYLQVGKFNNPDELYSRYFMIVNRRCSPIDTSDSGGVNGRRSVTIKLDSASTHFAGFNNWSIYDLERDSLIITFDKRIISTTNLGWFLPGEGKLYKLAPVMQEGGTLVANESINNINFNCNGDVNNDGKNISLYVGTTVNFADGVKWNITGGEFKSGLFPDSPNQLKVNMKSQSGAYWNGIDFTGCAIVTIANTIFESVKLSGTEIENPSALLFVDCYDLSVSGCKFNFANLDSLSCLYINYLENEEEEEISCNLLYNEFNTGGNKYSTVFCAGFAESVIPLMINGNDFNSTNGNNAILLSGVAGGAIKDNIITGYNNGIILIWSAMDLYGNIITGGDEDSKGVISCALSYSNLSPNGFVYTGGYNSVSCEGENAECLEFDNSYSYLNDGYNIFNLNGYDPGNAFHIAGTIPDLIYDEYGGEADAINNCFRISNIDTNAVANVERLDEEPFNFIFTPYYCGENLLEGMIAFDLGNGMYDTIYTEPGGSGGSISGVQFPMFNGQSATFENLSDSVSINLRKRDYERVSDLCYQLLTDHIDSLKDVSIILKLYLAELRLDSSGNRITNFKSFLEALILNNPEKVTLVKQSYYVIQKCKVSLGMYESAMTGFQEIVNQNPYSYEGLIAGWDYSATSLLSGGQGGG